MPNPTDPASAEALPDKPECYRKHAIAVYERMEPALMRFSGAVTLIAHYQHELLDSDGEANLADVVLRMSEANFNGWRFTVNLLQNEFNALWSAYYDDLTQDEGDEA